MKEAILASLAAVTLAACGGSGSAVVEDAVAPEVEVEEEIIEDVAEEEAEPVDVVLAPANGNLGPNNITFAQSASGLEVFLTVDGETKSISGLAPVLADLGVTQDVDTGFNILAGTDVAALLNELINGDLERPLEVALALEASTAAAAASVGTLITIDGNSEGPVFAQSAAFARLTDTTLPLSGTATFNGDYVALLTPSDLSGDTIATLNPNALAIGGNVALTADFENALISGEITDRQFLALTDLEEPVDATGANITFQTTQIDETGAFAGVASGDSFELQGEQVTTDDGVFSGLIAGATGNEAVGAVALTHTSNGDTFTELGSFIAAE